MSYNFNLVEHFLNPAFQNDKSRLKPIVADSFTCISPFMKPQTFEQYSKFTSAYSNKRSVQIEEIATEDDTNFDVKYKVTICDEDGETVREKSGLMNIEIADKLVSKLVFNDYFDASNTYYRKKETKNRFVQ